MKVRIFKEPCYFAESLCLLHAFVNHVSFEEDYKRVAVAFSCHIGDADEENHRRLELLNCIYKRVTQTLDPEGERLRYYFENLEGMDKRNACCLARVMLVAIPMNLSSIDQFAAELLSLYREMERQGIKINDINAMGLAMERWDTPGEPEPLAGQLERLPCTLESRWKILRALTDFEHCLTELTELIRPVAEILREEMAELVAFNQKTLEAWGGYFQTHTVDDYYREMFNTTFLFVEEDVPHEIWLGLWCFNMLGTWTEWLEPPEGRARVVYIGMCIRLEFAISHKACPDVETICNMARVLGSKDKMDILRRCAKGPISAARLVEAMNLNSGTVSRNLYSLYKLGYLETRGDGERVNYVTKLDAVEQLFRWVVEYISENHL